MLVEGKLGGCSGRRESSLRSEGRVKSGREVERPSGRENSRFLLRGVEGKFGGCSRRRESSLRSEGRVKSGREVERPSGRENSRFLLRGVEGEIGGVVEDVSIPCAARGG